MRREALSSVCGLAMLFGGCPKRQPGPRIVYVPSPPPEAAPATGQGSETIVIEEPPPPAPVAESPPQEPRPRPAEHRPRRAIRNTPDAVEVAPEPAEPAPTVEIPALEPRESPQQESTLRRDLINFQDYVRQRIARLDTTRVSNPDRRIIEDARTFLAQSVKALEEGDLQRSYTLAHKAHLLVTDLERRY